MKSYKQIIPAAVGIMASCYYVDEDGKRNLRAGEWEAPIICYGLTERGDIEPLVIDCSGKVFAPYIKRVYWQGNFRA